MKVKIYGKEYESTIVFFGLSKISKVEELEQLRTFNKLKKVDFYGANLNDLGLKYVANCKSIEVLNLQFTEITDEGIQYLVKLKKLKFLRLKECEQITNECIPFLNKISSLENLQIQETEIDEIGLLDLHLPNLTFLCIEIFDNNFQYDSLVQFSKKNPNCEIIAKGNGSFCNGKFEGMWMDH